VILVKVGGYDGMNVHTVSQAARRIEKRLKREKEFYVRYW
jgi:hypothetical protein